MYCQHSVSCAKFQFDVNKSGMCACVYVCVCVCGGASTLYLVTLEQINPLITSVHVCCLVCFN